jgi:hypothetical protein
LEERVTLSDELFPEFVAVRRFGKETNGIVVACVV